MEPTDEQVKELWKLVIPMDESGHWWHYPDGFAYLAPTPITLDNLFKYAVPKLKGMYDIRLQNSLGGWYAIVYRPYSGSKDAGLFEDKDPSIALFWAIYAVLKEGIDV